jgi:adenylate cyclase
VSDDLDDLLDGLTGEARAARGRLISDLLAGGATDTEIRAAAAENRLPLLPVDRELAAEPKYTVEELAEKSGLDVEQLRANRRAFGLMPATPGERLYDDTDVDVAQSLKAVLDAGVSDTAIIELNRVIGRATFQIAAAARSMFADALFKPGVNEHDIAVLSAAAARELVPRMRPTLTYAFEAHLRELLQSDVINASDVSAGTAPGAREVAVAFADLVGFTRLGEEIPAEDLGDVVGQLEDLTAGLVDKPVTFVKTLGDAVMLVAPDVDSLIETSLKLTEAELPQRLRVGIGFGPALERAGDWYGSPVNQASRVTAAARPGSVLVTESAHKHAQGDWQWSYARERKLKGVGEVKLFRARRPSASEGSKG